MRICVVMLNTYYLCVGRRGGERCGCQSRLVGWDERRIGACHEQCRKRLNCTHGHPVANLTCSSKQVDIKTGQQLTCPVSFDRVHHIKVFNVLLYLNFPGGIVNLLLRWYCEAYTMVRWSNNLSSVRCAVASSL